MPPPSVPRAVHLRPQQIDLQRVDFQRLGVLGDWEHPYLTMDPRYEAQQIRALGKVIRNGHVYQGVKPVHWCLDCRSALAEAEVEYEEHTSPAIDVAFRVVDNAALERARRTCARVPGIRTGRGRDLDDHALDASGQPGRRIARCVSLCAR